MSFYLRHAIGFFTQIYPCTLLCFLPFSKENLRFSWKRIFGWLTAGMLLLSALFPLIHPSEGGVTHDLYMVFAVSLFASAFFWLLRETLIKKMLVINLVMFYAVSLYWLVNLVLPFFNGGDSGGEVYGPKDLFLWVPITVITLHVAVQAFRRVVRDLIREIETKSMRREFLVVWFSTLIYFGMTIYYNSTVNYASSDFWQLYGIPSLLMFLEQCLVYWLLLRESVRRRRDSDYQKTLEIQQFQYENITREMENDRRMRHDMRHWLGGLSALLEQNKPEEMKAYLAEVIDQTARGENRIYCQNSTVNGLLQYYVGLARNEDIRCRVQADCGDLTISPTDLTVVFGNVMENAIRACRDFPEGRYITIQVGTFGGSMVIQIENPCKGIHPSGRYRLEGGFLPAAAFLSPRAGGGYGLSSLEHTARKYGGDAWFRYDETAKTFTTRIRMNLHPDVLK